MRRHTLQRHGIVVLLQGLSMGLYAQRTYVQLDNGEILYSLGYAAYKVRIVKVLQASVHRTTLSSGKCSGKYAGQGTVSCYRCSSSSTTADPAGIV